MLKMDNIKFVKEHTKDGITYMWFVSLKNNEYRYYENRENGRVILKEYNKSDLPKTMQKFINSKVRVEIYNDGDFIRYIYQ